MRNLRHIVNVHRPTQALDSRGQANNDTVYWRDVPCSIEAISATEGEAGGQQQAVTTYKVEMYGNPLKPLKHSDWLKWGSRKLNIEAIDDTKQNGEQLVLTCGERHEP